MSSVSVETKWLHSYIYPRFTVMWLLQSPFQDLNFQCHSASSATSRRRGAAERPAESRSEHSANTMLQPDSRPVVILGDVRRTFIYC